MLYIKIFASIIVLISPISFLHAQDVKTISAFDGVWVINEELTDDPDQQVEKAIKSAGGRPTKKKGKGRYKGGPEEQALYDHISYDEILMINYKAPEFHLTYEEKFTRIFYTDGRSRSISASGSVHDDDKDYSFASWESETKFIVESRPRDGGSIAETYSLSADGKQLFVELHLEPLSFLFPIKILRIYNKGM